MSSSHRPGQRRIDEIKKIEEKISKYNYFPESFRDCRKEKRPIEKIMSEKIPSRLLPNTSAKFLLVRTNDVQEPNDRHFAMQVLGTVDSEKEANEITESLDALGYNQFPYRLLPLNVWRVFPPPLGSGSEQEYTHQAILRQILNRDVEDLNLQEDLMEERLAEAREYKASLPPSTTDTQATMSVIEEEKTEEVKLNVSDDKVVVDGDGASEAASTTYISPVLPSRSERHDASLV